MNTVVNIHGNYAVWLGLLLWYSFVLAAQGQTLTLPRNGTARVDLRAIGYARYQEPEVPSASPIPIVRTQTALELRPDFLVVYPYARLTVKPRFWAARSKAHSPPPGEWESETDLFLNEAVLRLSLRDDLFLIGGRENLQWGPSLLLSPSNPFIAENVREDAFAEMPGIDYVRAVWVASYSVTASLIANIGEGRHDSLMEEDFRRRYAAKLDLTGAGRYAGFIGSLREDALRRPTLGAYAGANAGEAVVLYAEGQCPPEMDEFQALAGGSYTFWGGGMLSVEFFHNGPGMRSGNDFIPQAAEEPTMAPDAFQGSFAYPRAFFRKNYLYLQYHDTWRDLTEGTLRFTQGLDDGSHRLTGIVRHALNDYFTAFLTGHIERGSANDEFGRLVRGSVAIGLEAVY